MQSFRTETAPGALLHDPATAQDDRIAVRPRKAAEMLGCGLTRVYELMNSGELPSYKDGASRMVLTSGIRARIARLLQESGPPNQSRVTADHAPA